MYKEFYNIMSTGPKGSPLFLSFLLVIVIALLFYFKVTNFYIKNRLIPIIGVVFLIVVSINRYKETKEFYFLRGVLLNKEHSIIEGKIENLIYDSSNSTEVFTIDGHEFNYHDNKPKPLIDNIVLNERVLKNGLDVRIFYYENTILGFWIKE